MSGGVTRRAGHLVVIHIDIKVILAEISLTTALDGWCNHFPFAEVLAHFHTAVSSITDHLFYLHLGMLFAILYYLLSTLPVWLVARCYFHIGDQLAVYRQPGFAPLNVTSLASKP